MSPLQCEVVDGRIFTLPEVVQIPDLKLLDRFAHVSTPLIENGHFSFRKWGEMARSGDIKRIPASVVVEADEPTREAVKLTNAALDCLVADFRAPLTENLHDLLRTTSDAKTCDLLLAYLPCLSAMVALVTVNLTQNLCILDAIESAESVSEEDRLAVLGALDAMCAKAATVVHFGRRWLLPTAEMNIQKAVQFRAWWNDLERVAKRLRYAVPPEFMGVKAENSGAKKLYDSMTKGKKLLDDFIANKRKSKPVPVEQIDADMIMSPEEAAPASAAPCLAVVQTQRIVASNPSEFDVRYVVDGPALKSDSGLKKAASEWSGEQLENLCRGLVVRRLRSENFLRLIDEVPHAEKLLNDIARNVRLHEAFGRAVYTLPRPILLVGEPGTGKTWLARRLAEVSGLPCRVIPMGGADSKSIAGSHRSWAAAVPSVAVQSMSSTMFANVVIVLDELEKSSRDDRMNPHGAVLSLLERSTAKAYHDQFLLAQVDASHINFVMTANSLSALPAPLLSRCDIYHLRAPSRDQYPQIVSAVRKQFAQELGIDHRFLPEFDGDDLDFLCAETNDIRTLVTITRRILERRCVEAPQQRAWH